MNTNAHGPERLSFPAGATAEKLTQTIQTAEMAECNVVE